MQQIKYNAPNRMYVFQNIFGWHPRTPFGARANIAIANIANIAIANKYSRFRLACIHLTLAILSGQGQDHSHLHCEYL